MLLTRNTPKNTGIAIYGDYMDFENIHDALHNVVGDEGEFSGYDSSQLRVLGLCYDIRHALMGNREFEFIDNGLDEDKKRRMEILASDKNLYLKINILWPEMLFVMIALNDFLRLYAKKMGKIRYSSELFTHPKLCWDKNIAQVRQLQVAVAESLQEILTEATYTRLLNVMNDDYVSTHMYVTQYIDYLNDKFIKMKKEKRLKSILKFAKGICQQDDEYEDIRVFLEQEAKNRNCHVDALRLAIEYPDDIQW